MLLHHAIGTFCEIAQCQRAPGVPCSQPQADPVSLPPLSNNIPQYYKGIIASCRAVDPVMQPPAWRLLVMFPPAHTPASDVLDSKAEMTLDLELIADSYSRLVTCDGCSNETYQWFSLQYLSIWRLRHVPCMSRTGGSCCGCLVGSSFDAYRTCIYSLLPSVAIEFFTQKRQ